MKTLYCNKKCEFTEAAGRDWFKIVKVCGGYIGFENRSEYDTWKVQK